MPLPITASCPTAQSKLINENSFMITLTVKIVEAQIGNLLKESDIIRYKDIYGRIK